MPVNEKMLEGTKFYREDRLIRSERSTEDFNVRVRITIIFGEINIKSEIVLLSARDVCSKLFQKTRSARERIINMRFGEKIVIGKSGNIPMSVEIVRGAGMFDEVINNRTTSFMIEKESKSRADIIAQAARITEEREAKKSEERLKNTFKKTMPEKIDKSKVSKEGKAVPLTEETRKLYEAQLKKARGKVIEEA